MPRLFVAIDLPAAIRDQLAALCCGLPGARWVEPEQLHLTLRFIGEVDGGIMNRVREALAEVRAETFSLQLAGVGFFPPRGNPRVAWVGISKNELLLRLHHRVEAALIRAGFPPEERKYSPHITLALLKATPASRAGGYLAQHNLFATEEFPVREFLLYSSVLNSRGARHYIEAGYPLEDAGDICADPKYVVPG